MLMHLAFMAPTERILLVVPRSAELSEDVREPNELPI